MNPSGQNPEEIPGEKIPGEKNGIPGAGGGPPDAPPSPKVIQWPCSCEKSLQVPREMAREVIECPWCGRMTSGQGPIPEWECPICHRRLPVYSTSGESRECRECRNSRRLRRLKDAAIALIIGLAAFGTLYLIIRLGMR